MHIQRGNIRMKSTKTHSPRTHRPQIQRIGPKTSICRAPHNLEKSTHNKKNRLYQRYHETLILNKAKSVICIGHFKPIRKEIQFYTHRTFILQDEEQLTYSKKETKIIDFKFHTAIQ